MAASPRAQWLSFVVAALFILAGLRNMFLPGFLSMSAGHGSGATELVAGLIIFILAVIGVKRSARTTPH